jgi:hypothetical protein
MVRKTGQIIRRRSSTRNHVYRRPRLTVRASVHVVATPLVCPWRGVEGFWGADCRSSSAAAPLHDTDSAYQIAEVYAFRGESGKSFEWLNRGYKQRDARLPDIKIDPLFNNLRHDPRYAELLKRMRLPT